jgi:hypothetical protein
MKRNPVNHTQQQPLPKKSNSRIWLLGILGIGSLLVVLQFLGIFKSVNRASATGWMDLKSAEYQNRPMPELRSEKPNPHVDATLQEVAAEFEGQVFSDIRTANKEKGWGLSEDEAKFYDDMRGRYAGQSSNWLGLVKKSYSTYRMVKDAFGGSSDISAILKDANSAANIYAQLNQQFGISPTESHNFAQTAQARRISDWANFVENNKKR